MDMPVQGTATSLSIVNHPPTRLPGPSLLHLLVQGPSQDGQTAIDFLSSNGTRSSLSYGELHHASEALAIRLSALVGPLDPSKPLVIPVLLPQSLDLYIALLAILKAGGAFCPMNLDVPLERAKFILEDVSAKVVITAPELASKLPDGDQAVLIMNGEIYAEPPAVTSHRQPTPADLAYVMYTSGSTGTPKGVGISHDAVTQSLLAHDRHIPQFTRFLQFAAPTFDVSVFEIFFPLYRGKTLVSCARSALLNELPGVIRDMDVDACELTPSVAASLLRKRENASGLRLLLTIGEMLTQPVVEEFGGDQERPSMLWGMYGPTEASIHCTLQPAFARDSVVRNIGVPLDTVSAFILKIPEEGSESPDFLVLGREEVGELAIGGHQLADGYLNRPEQTSSTFIDTPYGRLYRTGDKARMLADGTLECLGRIADGQVKLRGQRMELGEVEHAALRTPGCHSAVAAVMDVTLVLFCAFDGTNNAQDAILESCRQWLPGFMHPGEVVVVEHFPRLASGKVDKKQLVADYASQISGIPSNTTFKDELEKRVCDLASHCLGTDVQPNLDLARAGLDSLTAIRLASCLRDGGLSVGAIDVLEARTVSALLLRIRSKTETEALEFAPTDPDPGPDVSEIVANSILSTHNGPIEAIIPCTPLQSSMLAETMADARAYCNWVQLNIAGAHSADTVRSWLSQIANANEALRTGFTHYDGRFLQVIFEQLPESSISITDSIPIIRDFELCEDEDFLRPFRAQISICEGSDNTMIILQIHHAVYDGWSLDLVRSDLARLDQGKEFSPRPQFRQISAYHQSAKTSQAFDAAREFWSQSLLGFQPSALPNFTAEVNRAPAVLSSTTLLNIKPGEMKMTLQEIDCGPQTIFQATLACIWSSMVGATDVVVGSIQSGRTIPVAKIEDIIGPCIATAPIRTDLSQVRTIRDLLVNINAGNREALPHSLLPLAEIKRAAGVRSGQSLYDVLFIYQESLYSSSECVNTVKQVDHRDYLETKLLVEIEPGQEGFNCRLTYHSDVLPKDQIRVVGNLISALIPYMLKNIDSDISSVWKACPQHLLSIFNPKPKTFNGIPDLATAVECISEEFPDKDAICFAENISNGVLTTTTITFAELNKMADRIAWHLAQHGVGETGVVAIIMEKSVRLYAGILAILKTGCAYLPLLPSTPMARIETIFQQAGVKVCVVDTATQEKVQQRLECNCLNLQSLDLQATPILTKPAPDPERLAYVIYTSGSTGVPKGVCLTQRNIMSNLDMLSQIYPVEEHSRLLQSCSQAFDVSVFEIFFTWTRGMCLCSGTNDTLFEDLERSIRKLNVTHLSMTPTVASLVDPAKVPRVQFLVTAGEPMTEAVTQKWGDKLYQGYGPSETTNICSVKKMSANQAIQHLGWSFDNTSTFVLAQNSLEAVPFGSLGEFCFGGDQIAQGYLNLEALTAAKFIYHPTFGRIYRSGDLGRMLTDGSMVILGRADEQIKIRGQRVELDEVTEAIRQSGNVDCATLFLTVEDTGTRDQIISFVVLKAKETAKFQALLVNDEVKGSIQSIYRALGDRLPLYMLPSAIIPISALPTTSSGKLDKARLKQTFRDFGPDRLALVSYGAEHNADDGEWSTIETEIAQAISGALNVRRTDVQRWTPLATLGLDSISAIQASRDLDSKLGIRFPISTILQNPSVARLAKVAPVTESRGQEHRGAPELLPSDFLDGIAEGLRQLGKPFAKILPCTPLQEAMLATSSTDSQYLNQMLFRVSGDLEQLRQAWNAMVARHDILRTCFIATNDARWPILQIALDPWQPSWHDLGGGQSDIDDCIHKHAQIMPDAVDSLEPAVSFATFRQNDNVYLSFLCHHALYDGVAIERLLYEVEQYAFGARLPRAPAYDRFLGESLRLPDNVDRFWLEHLASYEPKLTASVVSTLAKTQTRELSYELDVTLSQATVGTKELGVSLLALVQTAWAITLGRIFKTEDVCFGNVVNGRSLPIEGISELVAPCFNTIPIRMDLSHRQRNLDVMRAFQKINAEVMNYQFTPLRRIQSIIPDVGCWGLFDTLLLLQQPSRALDQSLWTLERDDGEMDVPLVCEVIPNSHSDQLFVKMHTAGSRPLSQEIAKVAYDLFSDALRNCLQFPGSHTTYTNISQGLAERLAQIEYLPPSLAIVATEQESRGGQWTEMEISVREVLETLVTQDSENIQRDTTIYRLGLDSISAVQIASMLRKRGHQVVASDVIENPTCASLAQFIETRTPGSGAASAYDITRFHLQVRTQLLAHGIISKAVEAVLPCTPVQSAMMAQFIKSGGRAYFNQADFELDDDLGSAKVVEAWHVVLREHPILRTTIVPVEHDDCAFTMVQYYADMFEHGSSTITESSTDSFNFDAWKLDASEAAFGTLRPRLWSVAVVKGKTKTKMHLVMHHALYDAHSLQSILDDLSRVILGRDPLPRPPVGEAVADILGHALSNSKSSAEFWKQQAENVVINKFPVLTPLREATREILTESTMSGTTLTTLETAASRSAYPVQVILQAAWTRVLSAYLGETSVVFGVVLFGRNAEATRNAVFPCITTLPVITRNADSNQALLTQMLSYNTNLYKEQHQPLTRIQRWLGCPDSKPFDSLLVYQRLDRDMSAKQHWKIVNENANVDYPVSIEVEPTAGGQLRLQITFFSDILAKEQAMILLKQFDAAFQHLAFSPFDYETDLFKLHPALFSILPPETAEIPTQVKFLHQFVEVQALQAPDATALHFVTGYDGNAPIGDIWTYAELNDNGNRVAQLLLSRVKPGDIVAVYFDKCPEAYFSILGILKAGCAFLALDPGAPRARNEFILQDSGASVLVTSRARKDNLELSVIVPTIFLDRACLLAASSDPPVLNLEPNNVCYCLYTSGTTGTPKGCEITHDNAVQCMLAFQHIFSGHWQDDSRWLQFASLHFDVSVLEQYWSWSVGITLVAAPRDLILEDLAGTISRLGITHIDLTPSLARLLHPDDVPTLCKGVFITGGESLKQEILDIWGSKGVIYNFYGPTEATIGVTVFPRVPTNGRASNIGKQFLNVGSYVLKPGTQQPVLRGGIGELCVSGRLVGKGYLKRQDLTAERFPTLQQFGDRVYRTGDLVRVLHDGCFDFLGRADDQVKLRGQRLEIGEINHTIRKGVDSIRDVATLVVRSESQKKDLLVSFITTGDGAKREESNTSLEVLDGPSAAELCQRARDACRSNLPSYMVPTYVLQVSFIPLSSNNKAETKRLATFFASLTADKLMSLSSLSNVSPRVLNGTGAKIAKVLATMQDVETNSVTAESSIFELGVDSITVLRLSRELKKEGFATASPSLILRHPLIGDLVRTLETHKPIHGSDSVAAAKQLVQACGHKHRAHVSQELGVLPDEIEYIAPCSPLQQGMISRFSSDSAYFNTFQFILAPGVSAERMRNALQRTVDANSILRTKFVSTVDGVVQVALNGTSLPWSEIRLEAGSPIEDTIREMRDAWLLRNQDRLVEPFRVVLVHSDGARVLCLHIFHGLYDANSFDLLLNQLASQYLAGGDESAETAHDTRRPSFIDALCHGPLQDFSNSRAFWRKHLKGAAVIHSLELATSPATINVTRKGHFGDLELLKTNLRVTHQALVQAAWVSVLAKHRSIDPTIGIIVSGRSIELDNAEAVVGPLFNTLPFHAAIISNAGSTWSSLIQQCHEFNTAVLAFQHVPLRDIQKWCSGGQPLFDSLFSFQRDIEPDIKQRTLWTAVESKPKADYPLALEASLDSNGYLSLLLVAQNHEATILATMMEDLEEALKNMTRDSGDLVGAMSAGLDPRSVRCAATNEDMSDEQPSEPLVERSPFEWTKDALMIRNEIADLADMDPRSVPENASLLSLGLDSIDVIRLSALLRKKGVNIKTSDLMKAQTIAAITELLQARAHDATINGTEGAPATQRINEAKAALRDYMIKAGELLDGEVVLPATPLQESMVMEMIKSDFQLYFNHDILELAPSVDVTRMADAWRTVIAGSPILRTRFVPVESPELAASYCQVIGDGSTVRITEVILNKTEELAKVCYTATLRAQKGAGRSDLLQLVFATDGDQTFLVLSIAHALYDGWSLSLIHEAVHEAYEGTYRVPTLGSYIHQLDNVLFQEHRDAPAFWAGFLQGVTPTLIPENQSEPDKDPLVHRDEVTWPVSAAETMAFCKANTITLQTLGQACWAAILAAKTGSLDVTFGVVLSCRDTVSLEELVFPTMNTIPVRSVLHGTVSSWVRYMQENMNSIGPYRHFPLRAAKKVAKSNGPLFNTLFIQQRGLPGVHQVSNRQLMESVGGTSKVEYPVCVEMELMESRLVWRMACDGAYASQDAMLQMLRELNQVLIYIMRSPETGVLSFSGQRVSVCGQSPIVLQITDSVLTTAAHDMGLEEEDGPWSPLEEIIRDVLAAVSGTPATTILKANSIYHLGLDSISAVKAGSLLRKKGVSIGFRDMLKAQSISEMAMLAREAQSIPTPPESSDGEDERTKAFDVPQDVGIPVILRGIGIQESDAEEVLPATSMQVHMLSVWQNTLGSVFYPCFQYALSGQVDIITIATAWKTLVAETPMLRTVFVSTNLRSTPIMQITLHAAALDHIQLSVDNTTWHSRAMEDLPQPYSSLHAERNGDSWVLRLKIHHALYDAVSLPVIMDKFAALCFPKTIDSFITTGFKWRTILAPHLSDAARDARRQFWVQYLAGIQPQPPCPPTTEGDPTSRNGVGLQALFFAAYAEFLASTAARNGAERPQTMVFGIYLANRAENDPGTSTYPFLRLVPLRVVLRDTPSLFDIASEIQRDIHAISSPVHVEVGLWEIKDWTGVTIDSFVNFLAAAPSVLDQREDPQLELREPSEAGDPTTHDQLDGNFEELAEAIASNPVRDAFQDAVDVEVSVQDDTMTVGVFGSREKLGNSGGDRVIEGVITLLTDSPLQLWLVKISSKAKITVQTLRSQLVISRPQS
ncbi:hypothetical protein CHGG_09543 [Chaetomium globosum CBS 148.51]|uniref:Carrier domain-containing protein n=1 Tax=Chaetomium globosum (strain ATCC 6205 / CBS 148.51 / DSM 1962 / NBRC 6347 / NRRL 1970) TaxID=306901 RepID=Q2GR61_CHAGB|nr:uncharacterized protein CHGG_09543 [Chaetomium globosum CBS 148.51]EAQ85529.1 hypothetical protein CHGG_09543 [Chaetomium globosum CBS 148.51]